MLMDSTKAVYRPTNLSLRSSDEASTIPCSYGKSFPTLFFIPTVHQISQMSSIRKCHYMTCNISSVEKQKDVTASFRGIELRMCGEAVRSSVDKTMGSQLWGFWFNSPAEAVSLIGNSVHPHSLVLQRGHKAICPHGCVVINNMLS